MAAAGWRWFSRGLRLTFTNGSGTAAPGNGPENGPAPDVLDVPARSARGRHGAGGDVSAAAAAEAAAAAAAADEAGPADSAEPAVCPIPLPLTTTAPLCVWSVWRTARLSAAATVLRQGRPHSMGGPASFNRPRPAVQSRLHCKTAQNCTLHGDAVALLVLCARWGSRCLLNYRRAMLNTVSLGMQHKMFPWCSVFPYCIFLQGDIFKLISDYPHSIGYSIC